MTLNDDAEKLRKKLDSAVQKNTPEAPEQSGLGLVFRLSVELVSGLIVGVAIGYGLDFFFKTRPLFIIIFFMLGAFAGFINIFRALKGLGLAMGYNSDIKDDKKKK